MFFLADGYPLQPYRVNLPGLFPAQQPTAHYASYTRLIRVSTWASLRSTSRRESAETADQPHADRDGRKQGVIVIWISHP